MHYLNTPESENFGWEAKHEGKTSPRRPRCGWDDNIKMVLGK
jgi:hypothetical protein